MEEERSKLKKLSRLVADTSNALLDNFINDTAERQMQDQISLAMLNALETAAQQSSLVVLQVESVPGNLKFETVSGWVVSKKINHAQLVVKLQNDPQQMRIVSIASIQKVSVLTLTGQSAVISRNL
ncbi:MAG: hypothetical protein ACK5MW_06495 [Enterococcus sp.]